jgi:hypothetical protein
MKIRNCEKRGSGLDLKKWATAPSKLFRSYKIFDGHNTSDTLHTRLCKIPDDKNWFLCPPMQFWELKILNRSHKTYYNSPDSVPCWQDIHFPLLTGLLYKNRYMYSYIWMVLRLTIPTGNLDYSLSLFRLNLKAFPRPKMNVISTIRL